MLNATPGNDIRVVQCHLSARETLQRRCEEIRGCSLSVWRVAPLQSVASFHRSNADNRFDGCRGTLPYMAPELVTNSRAVSEKVDVWSLGTVLWEMLTLERPYHKLSGDEIMRRLMSCKSPDIPWCVALSHPLGGPSNSGMAMCAQEWSACQGWR